MHLLPAIDILDGRAVRLAKGDYAKVTVYNDDPADQAQRFEEAGATWLHVVDLDGAKSGVPENIALIERILAKTLLKVEVGGGIRSLDTIQRLYDAGVSRVVLGTSLVADPDFADKAIARYKGLLVAGIDAKGGEVAVSGWREGAGVPAEELAAQVAEMGFSHLVYTDIARDGMQTGIDETAYAAMAKVFGNPVTASGGVANLDDIVRLGSVAGSIEGVIAGRAVYEGSLDVAEAVAACEAATRAFEAALASENPCGGGCAC
ncbi:1-(5-phosphoribosyl)-5-[(5-phosphoribosylamino)methylideneamino]imidazole-4-carboxamide isomerase [Raoultibacter phocaeensis]|uniref:1-(5-phosphoribosyl)-5-[(5- phosphoribosylamino)methylideneamino]imidazole-4- carboxamide isomerase n=1 Tax=Raoultibacter phocaeensis TaxID=2479841 RepID=UPI00111BBF0B|nr:1-(5-phosphoribosyl)-5-[(5-phosphoribosylamino)methylideneamino]imidazole-4-carboxamide isomerase [Raoultibacter phocaeensis]